MKAQVKRQKWGEDTMIVIRGENRQATIDAYYWFWHYSIAGLAPDNELLNWCDHNVVQFQTNEAKYVHGASRARLNYLIDNEAERFKGVKGGAMAEARQFAQDSYNQIPLCASASQAYNEQQKFCTDYHGYDSGHGKAENLSDNDA
tara:strand:+ start:616 stop:1053 length:438 start_codon:yes stop_codon:yes gene_type:complete